MERHIRFDTATHILHLLDQRLLPCQEVDFLCHNVDDIITALQVMVVRGAPAIGVTAAWGCVIAAYEVLNTQKNQNESWQEALNNLLDRIAEARPTAINLAWGVNRMRTLWIEQENITLPALIELWTCEADIIHRDDIAINKRMGAFGGTLMDEGDTIMTHCNAGALATAGYGTALGVIRGAIDSGKKVSVIANETRPFLQGARLTAFELKEDNIPVTVACDNAGLLCSVAWCKKWLLVLTALQPMAMPLIRLAHLRGSSCKRAQYSFLCCGSSFHH